MDTKRYTRKSFDVEAVQVTEENMEEVRAWCDGVVKTFTSDDKPDMDGKPYVRVRVHHPLSIRQTRAFVNDWVLYYEGKGFKVYTDRAFQENFENYPEPTSEETVAEVPES